MKTTLKPLVTALVAGLVGLTGGGQAWSQDSLQDVMKKRGLTEKDILAAAKTYTPSGGRDEYLAFSSGGQSGHVIVYGIPSMRILKYIGVFTPEPWQGYGFDDESKEILAQGKIMGKDITYGDTHHPALSETEGDYDGRYLFINDKANPRVAVIDLKDFETKQIVVNPLFRSEHGGAFVTPNTEYVMEATQYQLPIQVILYRSPSLMTSTAADSPIGSLTVKRASSINPNPSRLNSLLIPKIYQTLVKAHLSAGDSLTLSVQNAM